MKTFGQEVKTNASLSSDKINKLRIDLIEEELEELKDAIKKKDLKDQRKKNQVKKKFSNRLKRHLKNYKENHQRAKLQNIEEIKEINISKNQKKN